MKSYWIWNYGDYEIYHSNLANSRRQEYGADYPVFWKYYDVDKNVKFVSEEVNLKLNSMLYPIRAMQSSMPHRD